MEASLEEQEQEQEQEQDKECLVCLQPCEELSVDLFLYSCSCIYPVHDACFKEWRTKTKNDRVCMICREELDYNTEEEEEPIPNIRRRIPDPRVRSIEDTIDAEVGGCMAGCCRTMKKIIWIVCMTILITILLEAIRPKRQLLMPSSLPPQASSL